MIKTLRPYQQEAFDTLRKRLKETTQPLLVNASVGAGKTMIISSLLQVIERANWKALCLTMNSNLIEQNADSYIQQGGKCGLYCAGLGSKNTESNIIFASPHSISQGLKKNKKIKDVKFNLIIIDECHNINHHDNNSMYMRILNHYGFFAQQDRYSFRVIGLTGTPYRDKSISIVGENEYFKEETVKILMPWLIDNGYLVSPIFEKPHVDYFDTSKLRVDNFGKFKHKDLQAVVKNKERLTGEIMREIVSIIEGGRNGAFIFASTVEHAHECMRSLPNEQAVIITAKTKGKDRKKYLKLAREGKIKYLVSVATLLVGVDVSNFDVCAWLRPTESLTLFVQGIGRVLRLHEGKTHALVLDYCGNLERHGDIDDPIINAAIQPKEKDDPDYCIPCYQCGANNTVHARRCVGIRDDSSRCDYYFEFKECDCGAKNDITSRLCRLCSKELIDPNAKLKLNRTQKTILNVTEAQYWITFKGQSSLPIINVRYKCDDKFAYESFYTSSEKAQKIFYVKFLKQHCEKPSAWYSHMTNVHKMREMINEQSLKTPYQLECTQDEFSRFKVQKKLFYNE